MKLKTTLCLTLVLSGAMMGCTSVKPSVRLESCRSPQKYNQIYADADYKFVFVERDQEPEVIVFSEKRQQWKHITEVSLTNAKWGESPRLANINMDFGYVYKGRDYAPLPFHNDTGHYPILPDKIGFDADRKIYLVYFNSQWRDVTVTTEADAQKITTRLEIRKKDLDESFNAK